MAFQYKIINRILTTNLQRRKYTNIGKECTFCGLDTETIVHLLCECSHVQKMWTILSKWCKYHYNLTVKITNELIILNAYVGNHKYMINDLILLMKRYIRDQMLSKELKFNE